MEGVESSVEGWKQGKAGLRMQPAGMVGVVCQVKQSRSLVTPVGKPVGKYQGKFQEHEEFSPDCQTAVTAHDQHSLRFGRERLLITSAFPPPLVNPLPSAGSAPRASWDLTCAHSHHPLWVLAPGPASPP